MAIPILIGLLFITPCIVFEVHGYTRRIQVGTPGTVSRTKEEYNSIPESDHNTGDVFRNTDDSFFSSFPQMKDLSGFGFSSFDKPLRSPSFSRSNSFKPQSLMTGSVFDDMHSLFQNPTKPTSFSSNHQNNDVQNADRSIGKNGVPVNAIGLKPLPRQQNPTDPHDIINSIFDQIKLSTPNGLQPMKSTTNFKIEPLDYNGMRGMMMTMNSAQCCINGECFELRPGETCGGLGKSTNNKMDQRQPIANNQLLNNKTPGLQGSDNNGIYSVFGNQNNLNNNYPSGDGKRYANSNNFWDSYEPPSGPLNHPYVKPIGVREDVANNIRNDVLERSNYHRKNHNVPELKLNNELNNYAQEWANYLVDIDLEHRNTRVYGENLFKGKIRENVGQVAVDEFYDEIAKFRINDNGNENGLVENDPTHHLTQLLWKGSSLLGVGVSKNSEGEYTIVCNYNPKGNVSPLFEKNVPTITQEQIDAGKEREEEKQRKKRTQYTVVQSPMYTYP